MTVHFWTSSGASTWCPSAFILIILLHFLSGQVGRTLAQTTAITCPDSGWSCQWLQESKWQATATQPDLKGVYVTYEEKPSRRVSIVCNNGADGPAPHLPKELLRQFNFGSANFFRFLHCPQPTGNVSIADVLEGTPVQMLRFLPDKPFDDLLDPKLCEGLPDLQYLSLEGAGLTSLPPDLFAATPSLTTVNLKENQLATWPSKTFAAAPNVTNLEWSNNNLTELISPLDGLKHVKVLMLYNNQIRRISQKFFASLPSLEVVDLQGNQIVHLANNLLDNVPMLTSFRIFSNQIQDVPDTLLRLQTRLTILDFSGNLKLGPLPGRLLWNVKTLQKFILQRCNLQVLPTELLQTPGVETLTTLDLSRNNLTFLEANAFKHLTNLQTLDLSNNGLSVLPSGLFTGMRQLTSLNLAKNNLMQLDSVNVFDLIKLQSLDLSANNLTSIPQDFFEQMGSLQELNMAKNQLSFPEESEKPFKLPFTITMVDLSYNHMKSLPDGWLVENTQLARLDLSHNQLTVFNSDYCQPTSNDVIIDLTYNLIHIILINIQWMNTLANMNADLPPRASQPQVLMGNNPYVCDCNSADLLYYYQNQGNRRYSFLIDMDDLECHSSHSSLEPNLTGRMVTSLQESELICDEQGHCPQPCHCFRYAMGNVVEVDCKNQNLKLPPDSAPFNTSSLRMDGNNLTSFEGLNAPQWVNLTHLHLSHNHIVNANPSLLPANLTYLDLQGNALQEMGGDSVQALYDMPQLSTILLQENPWQCDCQMVHFKGWLTENAQRLGNVSAVACNNTGRPISVEDVCPPPEVDTQTIVLSATVICVILAVGLAMTGITYYRYQRALKMWLYAHHWCLWFVTEQELDRNKPYDAFISFAQDDADFVCSELLPGLEQGNPPFKVCIHYRDWLAGEWIPDQIVRSVQDSRRTIVVLSKNFIRSVWGRLEFKAAHHQALQDRTNRVVMIVFGDIPPPSEMDPELRMYIKFNTYLKWGDPWFWQKLRYAMPHSPLQRSLSPLHPSSPQSHSTTIISTFSPPTPIIRDQPSHMTLSGNGTMTIPSNISEDKMELVRI